MEKTTIIVACEACGRSLYNYELSSDLYKPEEFHHDNFGNPIEFTENEDCKCKSEGSCGCGSSCGCH